MKITDEDFQAITFIANRFADLCVGDQELAHYNSCREVERMQEGDKRDAIVMGHLTRESLS